MRTKERRGEERGRERGERKRREEKEEREREKKDIEKDYNKHNRYPRGESYEDVIQRLEPVMLELERTRHPVLVVSHQGPLRCLYAYLMGLDQEECPFIPIPLHTVISLTPKAYGCEVKTYKLM